MNNVKDFGAVGDGVALDTAAVQRAIDAGGMVYFPDGVYLCGTLYLKSNGGLYLASGARLLASPNEADYNADDFCLQNRAFRSEGASGAHFITAVGQENITIRGDGVIDGNSPVFYRRGADNNFIPWRGADAFRPGQMLFFCECDRVTLESVRLWQAPFWSCFLHGCNEVKIHGLNINSLPWKTRQTDGIDIDCCRRVVISDCIIQSGDDCITLRGNETPLVRKQPCEYVTVTNCILSTATNAFRLGVGKGVVQNAIISNSVICEAVHGITINNRFKAIRSDGTRNGFCKVRNISFENMDIDALYPISVATDWFGVFEDPAGFPVVENIAFRNMRLHARRTCNIIGQPDFCVRSLTFSDIVMKLSGKGNEPGVDPGVKEWAWNKPNAAFHLQNVKDAEFHRVRVEAADPGWQYGIFMEHCEDIRQINTRMLLPDRDEP